MSRTKHLTFKPISFIVTLLAAYFLFSSSSLLLSPSHAQEPDFDRVNEIAKSLNCPTCSGINLADCRTQTCAQWKEQIGDLLQKGYTEQEVLDYFVTRYGVQVLQNPPKSGLTLGLWLLPALAILFAGGWLFYTLRRWVRLPTPAATGSLSVIAGLSGTFPTGDKFSEKYVSQVEKDLRL